MDARNCEVIAIVALQSLHIAQDVSRWLPTAVAWVRVRAQHVKFVAHKTVLGQVFSEYFGFPCQSSFNQFLGHENHPGLA
jgi:hypothetical protein